MRHSVNQSGFTLIELMITIAIMGVIASLAAPSMNEQIASMRQKDATTLLENTLRQARTDAMIYRVPITVTVNNTAKTITTTSTRKNAIDVVQNYNPKINVTTTSASAMTVTFTPTKTARSVIFRVCHNNRASDQLDITVADNANISASKTIGGCS